MQTWQLSLLGMIICYILTITCGALLLPVLKKKKCDQPILDVLPSEQLRKQGTPTLGGIFFIIPVVLCLLASLFFIQPAHIKDMLAVVITSFLFGIIGVRDDYKKLKKRQNEGLKAYQKLIYQVIVATAFVIITTDNTSVYIPFVHAAINLGWAYYPIMVIGICGVVNAVNITDGVDGLATTVTLIVSVFFFGISLKSAGDELSVSSLVMVGGCLGFLAFNAYPAKVFMGDTGSLFLGGMVCMMAKYSQMSLIIIIVGFVFIFEMISDILQIGSIKLRHGKKVFKMAPFHHHLEKSGWKETHIVLLAAGITLVLGALSLIFA